MTAADPFRFYREQHLHDGPVYFAPDEAVASWLELAEKVREELVRMGFAASVVTGDPSGLPHGARIWVNKIEPFGVTLDWDPPVRNSPEYLERVHNRDIGGVFAYATHASEIITRAMSNVLHEALFEVLIDHSRGGSYLYRVLKAPPFRWT